MITTDFTLEEIVNLFCLADVDHSGTLTRDEITVIMTQLKDGNRPHDEEINNCMRIMDTNGDGVISKEEFIYTMITWLGIVDKTTGKQTKYSTNHEVGRVTGGGGGGGGGGDSQSANDCNGTSSNNFNRKKTIQDMANFFLQFSPIKDYHEEQKKILSRRRHYTSDFDMIAVHREYSLYSPEQKVKMYDIVKAIMLEGRDVILHEIYSMDWSVVLQGIMKVKAILSIVELFPTSDEK